MFGVRQGGGSSSGTSLTEIYGVGPIVAAQLIGYAGDVRRFANRDALRLLQQDGTGRVRFGRSSGPTQIRNPGTDGRIYFERKAAEGKTKKEAIRSLKRQISNAVYRQLLLDAQ